VIRLLQCFEAPAISTRGLSALASLLPVAFVACLLTIGCARPAHDTLEEPSPIETLTMRTGPFDPVAESESRGRNVYKHYCSICHGDEGQGDGFNSTNLTVPPRDFSGSEFWRQATDERLLLTVTKGGMAAGKSVLMPAWGRTLTDRQLRDVVAFLHTLAAPGEPKAPTSGSPPSSQ
jgi:cytochrome c oxidase cbb3-type subunit 3